MLLSDSPRSESSCGQIIGITYLQRWASAHRFNISKIRDNPGSNKTVFQTAFAKLNIISRKRKNYSKSY